MSPEQLELAEKVIHETDPEKLTELVAELCRALDRTPTPANVPTPR